MSSRLRAALPSRQEVLVGAPLWGLLLCANAALNLMLRGWSVGLAGIVALLFFAGGCLAFPLAILAAKLLSGGRGRAVAFAASFLCLAVATVALTGGLYAVDYRAYYAQWHEASFTRTWAFQFVFTGLGAFYQFGVLGLRLMFPLGFLGLFAASWLLARDPR